MASFPTLLSPAKIRQLYFNSITASVRSGINAGSMLCLLLLVRIRATELFLFGASIAVVQIYGRWKSESALIYFRDASGIVAYAAAKAFETEVFSCIGGS
jgi:hypothetical protein